MPSLTFLGTSSNVNNNQCNTSPLSTTINISSNGLNSTKLASSSLSSVHANNNNNNNNNHNVSSRNTFQVYNPSQNSNFVTLNENGLLETSKANNDLIQSDIKKHIYLRNLCPSDIDELKALCAEWFPVE